MASEPTIKRVIEVDLIAGPETGQWCSASSVALSPDGSLLVTDGGLCLSAVEEFLLWDVAIGRRPASTTTDLARGYHPLMLKFSKSGRFEPRKSKRSRSRMMG